METINNSTVQWPQGLAEHSKPRLLIVVPALVALVALTSWLTAAGEPPRLRDNIPFISNTLQFLTDNEKFMKRVM
jgi:hypothetical protein